MQRRRLEAGNGSRVPAPEIKTVVAKTPHEHFGADDNCKQPRGLDDRKLIEPHVERIVVEAKVIEIHLRSEAELSEGPETGDVNGRRSKQSVANSLECAMVTHSIFRCQRRSPCSGSPSIRRPVMRCSPRYRKGA